MGGNEGGSEWVRVGVTMVLKSLCTQLGVNFVRVDVAHGWMAAGGGNFGMDRGRWTYFMGKWGWVGIDGGIFRVGEDG